MKANELMIGDWLQYYDCNLEKKCYAQVTSIQADGTEPYIQTSDSDVYYPVNTYKDISLTADILESIGFEPRDGHFILSDDYYDIDIWEYSDGIWIVKYDCCEMNMPFEQLTICYLHELQQFMRHCGIDKTIEYRLQTLVYGRERCIKKEK